MKVYHVKTSHRNGYTYEEPTFKKLHALGEYVMNPLQLQNPIYDLEPGQALYAIHKTYDSRGEEIEEIAYFSDIEEVATAMENPKRSNKQVGPTHFITHSVYDTIEEIPMRETTIQMPSYAVGHQRHPLEDFRFQNNMSLEDKLTHFMQMRESIVNEINYQKGQ